MASNKETRAVAGCLDAVWMVTRVAAIPFVQAWLIMLVLGILHGYPGMTGVPALGFGEVLLIVVAWSWLENGHKFGSRWVRATVRRAAARKAANEREAAAAAPQDPRVRRVYND